MSTLTERVEEAARTFEEGARFLGDLVGDEAAATAQEPPADDDGLLDDMADWVVGFVREHTGFGDMLDQLEGSTDAIGRSIDGWKDVGLRIAECQRSHHAMYGDLPSWEGPEAEAYADLARRTDRLFTMAGFSANGMSAALGLVKVLIEVMKELVDKALSWCVKHVMKKIATSWIPVAGQILALYGLIELGAYIDEILSKWKRFERAIQSILEAVQKATEWFEKAGEVLGQLTEALGGRVEQLPVVTAQQKESALQNGQEEATKRDAEDAERRRREREHPEEPPEDRRTGSSITEEEAKEEAEKSEKLRDRFKDKLENVRDGMGYDYPALPTDEPLMPKPNPQDEHLKGRQRRG